MEEIRADLAISDETAVLHCDSDIWGYFKSVMVTETSAGVWRTGTPCREFLFDHDLADACLHLMEIYGSEDLGGLINIGTGKDIPTKRPNTYDKGNRRARRRGSV